MGRNRYNDADTLEEVIVTAQNRVENVQKVPITIQVVGAEKLAETGFASLNDIQKVAPSVQLINDNSALRVSLRGVGSNTNGETDDASVTKPRLSPESRGFGSPSTPGARRIHVRH